MSTANTFLRALGRAAVVVANAHAESVRRNDAIRADQAEANKWEQRKLAIFETLDRGLAADHSRSFVSDATKRSTAARLRGEATEYANGRREIMLAYVEKCAAKFEQTGL